VKYAWLSKESKSLFREQQAWIREREEAKAWWEEQSANWQRLAEEREQIIREQQAWIGELEQARGWWEGQSANWQRLAEKREQMIREQQAKQASIWIRLGSVLGLLKQPGFIQDEKNQDMNQ
jgi:hypothetical protein